jgi:hypothetical protein
MSVEKCIGTYDCASVWLYEPDQESFSSVWHSWDYNARVYDWMLHTFGWR